MERLRHRIGIDEDYPPLSMPIEVKLSYLSLSVKGSLYDEVGDEVGYLDQRFFALSEDIRIYDNSDKNEVVYHIEGGGIDQEMDYYVYSKRYGLLGGAKRDLASSLWRLKYELYNPDDELVYRIELNNPWSKFAELSLSGLPIVGQLIDSYVLNATYHVYDNEDNLVAKMDKNPALLEGSYDIEKLSLIDEMNEEFLVLCLLLVVVIERFYHNDG